MEHKPECGTYVHVYMWHMWCDSHVHILYTSATHAVTKVYVHVLLMWYHTCAESGKKEEGGSQNNGATIA